MSNPKARVTIKQVAHACNLSAPTVSQILNGKGWYREATKSAVIATAERLGYRPNGLAQAVQRGHLGLVALVLPWQSNHGFQPEGLIYGIEAGLAARDLHLAIARMPDDGREESGYVPRVLRELTADAMILTYNARVPENVITEVGRLKVPAVWVNSRSGGLSVHPDDRGGAAAATRRLHALGHRRIAFLCTSTGTSETPWHPSPLDRMAGYQEASRDLGTPSIIWRPEIGAKPEESLAVARAFLAQPNRPTAVICYNTQDAMSLIIAALESGLSIPRDLSVVTFDVKPVVNLGLPLATVIIPVEAMGRYAVDLIVDSMAGEATQSNLLPMGWDPGATVAPPSQA